MQRWKKVDKTIENLKKSGRKVENSVEVETFKEIGKFKEISGQDARHC